MSNLTLKIRDAAKQDLGRRFVGMNNSAKGLVPILPFALRLPWQRFAAIPKSILSFTKQ